MWHVDANATHVGLFARVWGLSSQPVSIMCCLNNLHMKLIPVKNSKSNAGNWYKNREIHSDDKVIVTKLQIRIVINMHAYKKGCLCAQLKNRISFNTIVRGIFCQCTMITSSTQKLWREMGMFIILLNCCLSNINYIRLQPSRYWKVVS